MMKYNIGTGGLTNWLVTEEGFDSRYLGKCEALFAQGNGYLGLRNALEEAYVGETRDLLVTGTFNKAAADEVTELPNFPDITEMNIRINGYRLELLSGGTEHYERTLNLKNGETVRVFGTKMPDHTRVEVKCRRFVSLANEHLIGAKIEIITDREASVVIETGINGAAANEGAQHFEGIRRRVYEGTFMQLLAVTTESGVTAALHSACRFEGELLKKLPIMGRRNLSIRHSFTVPAKKALCFEKFSTVHSSRDLSYEGLETEAAEERMKDEGMALLKESYEKGYERLLEESARVWQRYWEDADVRIEGKNGYDQLALRFALYHLRIMVKEDDNRVGIGAKALTGEGYKGHSFWDTEMFILPYYTFTRPSTARTLLEYRYRNLYGAHKKAEEYGFEGAMYPWECAWIDDGEVTPLYMGADVVTGKITPVLTGQLEQHISADIAYAVWQYYSVTKDQDYMDRYGYEMICDTALFWASRLEYKAEADRYEITNVIGPDEYKECVDNNAYTNYMAVYNMKLGAKIADELKEKRPELYKEINSRVPLAHMKQMVEERVSKVYLPVPNENGIIPQTDQYLSLKPLDLEKYKSASQVLGIYEDYNVEQLNQYMVSKQADTVMLFFLLGDLFDEETKKKNFIFYEDKTLHDSSLSRSSHTILANDYGMKEMAYEMFERAVSIDLGPEMKSSDAGIHSASLGGIWEAAVMGFGGVRLKEDVLSIHPLLPEAWDTLSFPLVYQGVRLFVTAAKEWVSVENQGSREVSIELAGEKVTIAAFETVQKRI